jgi:hypothetical protein
MVFATINFDFYLLQDFQWEVVYALIIILLAQDTKGIVEVGCRQ